MANITITLDEVVMTRVRAAAKTSGKSISRWVTDVIVAEDARLRDQESAAMADFVALARSVKLDGAPYQFDRGEIYDEAVSRHERRDLQPRSARSDQTGKSVGVAEPGRVAGLLDDQPASLRRNQKRRSAKTRPEA
jgi:hypothetical protein